MMKLSILIALFVFANVSLANILKQKIFYCLEKDGGNQETVKEELFEFMLGYAETVSKTAKCVLACIFELIELVSPQRIFYMENVKKLCAQLTNYTIPPAELNYLLKSCESKATSTDRCEFIWSFVSCVEKNVRPHFIIKD